MGLARKGRTLRQNFEMTEADLETLLNASKPVPYLVVGGMAPRSPQQRANDAWECLGRRMGFDHMTVRPTGHGDRFFSAEVAPVEAQA